LQPWQCFLVCVLFGWLRKDNGRRRFRAAYLEIPRKNGKSILAAAIGLYMLLADGEYGAEVYSGATSEKQAWEVFKPAKLMLSVAALCNALGAEVNAKALTKPADAASSSRSSATPVTDRRPVAPSWTSTTSTQRRPCTTRWRRGWARGSSR
jgi:phage terminase large subunit-like protein